MKNREAWYKIAICSVALIALVTRLPKLDIRPLHTDEAVHMVKAGILFDTGLYEYNPQEYHGPTIYYFAWPFIKAAGAHVSSEIRSTVPFLLVPVLFSVGIVLLFVLFLDGLGPRAALLSAILAAASPAFSFYGRYYIQETVLVFFTGGVMFTLWRYTVTRHLKWVLAAAVLFGFAAATKESFVLIALSTMLGGIAARLYAPHLLPSRGANFSASGKTRFEFLLGGRFNRKHVFISVCLGLFVAIALLSGFFTHLRALGDAFFSYWYYVLRAVSGDSSTHGSGLHNHPWYWYMKNLVWFRNAPGPWWSEAGIIVLALVGIFQALRIHGRGRGHPFLACSLAFYTIAIVVVFSILPYKTPWNALPMLHALIIMAGYGGASLLRTRSRAVRWGVLAVLSTIVGHLCLQQYRANFRYYADYRNPYVYAGTSFDVVNLVKRVEEIAKVHPEGYAMTVLVISPKSDYWPIPWYLRRFRNVGYFESVPENVGAPVVIAHSDMDELLEPRLGNYEHEYFGLRADVVFSVFIRKDLWDAYIKKVQ